MEGKPLFIYLFEFKFTENGLADEHRAVREGTYLEASFYLAELMERGCSNITWKTLKVVREAC